MQLPGGRDQKCIFPHTAGMLENHHRMIIDYQNKQFAKNNSSTVLGECLCETFSAGPVVGFGSKCFDISKQIFSNETSSLVLVTQSRATILAHHTEAIKFETVV